MSQNAANAGPFSALPKGMCLKVAPDNMAAFLSLDAGYAGSLVETLQALEQEKISHGLDADAVQEALREVAAGEEVSNRKIAQGDLPIDAEDGSFEMRCQKVRDSDELDSKLNVDLREVNRYIIVKKNQLLAVLTPPKNGKGGKDIFGKIIPPTRPKAPNLHVRAGQNVREDEEHRFFAEKDGVVSYERNTLYVNTELEVDGDIDYKTGNIRFPGPVRIKGSITPNFKVEAQGDVHVVGNIQNARVTSLGSITVGQGIIGDGESVVLAKGGINAGWIENSAVEAGADVVVGSHIFQSRVNADGWIRAVRGKGAIVGGEVWAAKGIEVRMIGSASVRGTLVAIGGGVALNKQIADLNRQILRCGELLQKIHVGIGEGLLNVLLAAPEHVEKVPLSRREAVRALLEQYRRLETERAAAEGKRAELTRALENGFTGEIKALVTVFPGSIITIGRLSHEIKTEIDRTIFYGNFSADDIVMQPL